MAGVEKQHMLRMSLESFFMAGHLASVLEKPEIASVVR